MQRAGLRWRCPKCSHLSDVDPYLASVADGAPTLSGMPIAPEPTRRYVLTFVGHPLSQNDHVSLKARMRDTKRWREQAAISARAQGIPKLQRVRLSAVFYRSRIGLADEDNDRGRLKHVVDGLVRAGLLPNDTRAFVEWGDVTEERGPTGFALVIEALS